MADEAKALAPAADAPATGLSVRAQEVKEIADRIALRDHETIEAADLWSLPDQELKKLPARTQKIAREARKPRSRVAYGLLAAGERQLARTRRNDEAEGPSRLHLVIQLPPRRPLQPDDVVKVIDVEATAMDEEK